MWSGIGIHACMSYYHRRLPHRMEALRALRYMAAVAVIVTRDGLL